MLYPSDIDIIGPTIIDRTPHLEWDGILHLLHQLWTLIFNKTRIFKTSFKIAVRTVGLVLIYYFWLIGLPLVVGEGQVFWYQVYRQIGQRNLC